MNTIDNPACQTWRPRAAAQRLQTGPPPGTADLPPAVRLPRGDVKTGNPSHPQNAQAGHFRRRMRTTGWRVLVRRPVRVVRVVTGVLAHDQPQAQAACALSSSRHRMIIRKDAMRGSADYMKSRRDPVFPVLRRVTCGRPVN
jgi:hypothetical protein